MQVSEEQLLSNIHFFVEDVDMPEIDTLAVTRWIIKTIEQEEKKYAGLNIIFCSDEFLLRINQQHLKHDYYTDIITFPYQTDPIEGELYISVDRIKENASKINTSYLKEIHRVIIHGVLHLIGYDDKSESDKVEMTKKEDYYLQEIV